MNVFIWEVFMNAALKAAIHFGNDHDVNFRKVQNSSWRPTGQFSGIQKSCSVVKQRQLV